MAGDWIAVRSALASSPKLVRMARILGQSDELHAWAIEGPERYNGVTTPRSTLSREAVKAVVTAHLIGVWSYAREHGKEAGDDIVLEHLAPDDLDEITGTPAGFAAAMCEVGWLSEGDNVLIFPNFREFNPRTNAERQREYRDRKRCNGVTTPRCNGDEAGVTPTLHDTTLHDTTDADARAHARTREADDPPAVISLPLNDKTEHPVTEADVAEYRELYPAVDIEQELRKMRGWLTDNPAKRKTRKGIRRFIGNWLSREQDRGPKQSPPERAGGSGQQSTGKIGRALAAVGGDQ